MFLNPRLVLGIQFLRSFDSSLAQRALLTLINPQANTNTILIEIIITIFKIVAMMNTRSQGLETTDDALLSLLTDVCSTEKNVERSEGNRKALSHRGVTKAHTTRSHFYEESFRKALEAVGEYIFRFLNANAFQYIRLTFCAIFTFLVDKDGNRKWAKALKMVENPFFCPTQAGSLRPKEVPHAYVLVAGDKSQHKREMINAMVVDWQVDLRKTKLKKGQTCPFYSPVTQNGIVRTFFAFMKDNHGWQYTDTDFRGFTGSLNSVLSVLYDERFQQFVSRIVVFLPF